jgi:hypothetical protein
VPDDSVRYNAHCSLSNIRVEYAIDGGETVVLTSDAGRSEWVDDTPPIAGQYRPSWE